MTDTVLVVVQARMSSRRFPGKMLAPLRGRPILAHVVGRIATALPMLPMVVATSDHPTDDPLAAYVPTIGVPVFRGPLDRVFDRFCACADAHPCRWILRVNGDSPLIGPRMLQAVAAHADRTDLDLVTTIFPRSFPRGQNAELISVAAMREIPRAQMTAEDQEHVTPYFYRHAARYRIANVEAAVPSEDSFAVDSLDDLWRLEALTDDVDPEPRVTAEAISR